MKLPPRFARLIEELEIFEDYQRLIMKERLLYGSVLTAFMTFRDEQLLIRDREAIEDLIEETKTDG